MIRAICPRLCATCRGWAVYVRQAARRRAASVPRRPGRCAAPRRSAPRPGTPRSMRSLAGPAGPRVSAARQATHSDEVPRDVIAPSLLRLQAQIQPRASWMAPPQPRRATGPHVGGSAPACSLTMYAAYQSGQFGSTSPMRFSCSPWATAARRIALARSLTEPNDVAAGRPPRASCRRP
jgi:hypothetical protein